MNFVKDARDVRIIINKFNGTHHQREYDVMDIGFCAWKTNQKSLHWYHIQNAYTNVSNIAKIVKSFWNLFKQYLPIYVLFAGVEVLLVALSKTSQLKILQKKMTIHENTKTKKHSKWVTRCETSFYFRCSFDEGN